MDIPCAYMREPLLRPGWLCVWPLGFGPATALQTRPQKTKTNEYKNRILCSVQMEEKIRHQTLLFRGIIHALAHNSNLI